MMLGNTIYPKFNYLHAMGALVLLLLFFGGIIYLLRYSNRKVKKKLSNQDADLIETLLNEHVDFYKKIGSEEKKENFKNRVIRFIKGVRFTDTANSKHTLLDEVYIASSAIIPLFAFPDWEYQNIKEIILYENHFDANYKVDQDKQIMGMVGDGTMNDTMILSLRALREGFEKNEGSQTALHEFIHLIDKADGHTDGIPEYLISKELITPWLKHIRSAMLDIHQKESNLNPYAATNESEFFAVVSEYFFEKPSLLQKEHPELYSMLNHMFKRYT